MSDVKVRFDADTQSFRAEVDAATGSISKQSEKVAEAKNRILAATNEKIEAAKREGASTKELEQIATRSSERIAAVTEKNASNIISSLDRVEAKTKATQAVLNDLKFDTKGASEHDVTNQQKASALLRGGGVRAGENFLTQFEGANKIAGLVFPALGAAALAKELYHVGEAAKEAYDHAKELPEAIKDGFEGLNAPLEQSIDKLRIANDKLDITYANLHHGDASKPTAALEIDMIRDAADDAASSSRKAFQDVKNLLSQNKVGLWDSLMSGSAMTGPLGDKIVDQFRVLKDLQRDNKNAAKSVTDTPEAQAQRDAGIQAQKDSMRAYFDSEEKKRTGDVKMLGVRLGSYSTVYGGQKESIEDLHGAKDTLNDQDELDADKKANAAKDAAVKKTEADAKAAKDRAAKLMAASREANAAAEKAKRDEISAMSALWKSEDDDLRNAGDVTAQTEVAVWVQRIGALNKGSKGYAEEYETAFHNLSEAKAKARKQEEDDAKRRPELLNRGQMQTFGEQREDAKANGATPAGMVQLAELQLIMSSSENRNALAKNLDEATKAASRYADEAAKAGTKAREAAGQEEAAYQLAAIALAQQTGQMSKADAATQTATVHARQYAATMAELNQVLAQANAKDKNGAAAIDAQAAVDKAAADRKVQIMQEAAEQAEQTWQGALKNANALWVQDSRDSAKQVQELFGQTMDGMNQNLVQLMTGGKADFGSMFKGISKTLANDGLKRAESGIAGALNLGKADGSSSNPYHVVMGDGGAFSSGLSKGLSGLFGPGKGSDDDGDDDDDGGSSGVGGFLKKGVGALMSLFGGGSTEHRALGGPVKAGHTYDTDEAGIEGFIGGNGRTSFTAPSDGYIVPHDQMSGGGAANYNISVGAGVTPAETDMRVQSALRQVHPQVMRDSVKANKAAQARLPTGSRR